MHVVVGFFMSGIWGFEFEMNFEEEEDQELGVGGFMDMVVGF